MSGTWHIVALGAGLGEGSHALAFLSTAQRLGQRAVTWTSTEAYSTLLAGAADDLRQLRDPRAFMRAIHTDAAVVVLASSFTCAPLLEHLARWPGPVVSLEHTWIPWAISRPSAFLRIDRFLVVLPEVVFRAGLAQEGGPFHVPAQLLERMVPVGWVSTAGRDLPRKDQVVVYFGQPTTPGCAATPPVLLASLFDAIRTTSLARPHLVWTWVGQPPAGLPDIVKVERWLEPGDYDLLISTAALVICHHAIGTIGRAVPVGTPVLAMGPGEMLGSHPANAWADLEIHAWARAGVVEPCHGELPADTLRRRIEVLLDGGPWEPQYSGGLEDAVEEVAALALRG